MNSGAYGNGDYGLWAFLRHMLWCATTWWLLCAGLCISAALAYRQQYPLVLSILSVFVVVSLTLAVTRSYGALRCQREARQACGETDVPCGPSQSTNVVGKLHDQYRLNDIEWRVLGVAYNEVGQHMFVNRDTMYCDIIHSLEPRLELAKWGRITLALRRFFRERQVKCCDTPECRRSLINLLLIATQCKAADILPTAWPPGLTAADIELLWECYRHPNLPDGK